MEMNSSLKTQNVQNKSSIEIINKSKKIDECAVNSNKVKDSKDSKT